MIPNKVVDGHYGPMIINSCDQFIGRSIEVYGAWAADDIELIKSILAIQLQDRERICFYDVGANIGTHSVALARHFGSRIAIRSFEAQRNVYYMLCGNVAMNGLDNVICEHAAVSDVSDNTISVALPDYSTINNFGGVELITPRHSDNGHMVKPNTELVKTVTIDQFNEAIDFIKLDVEGMEHLALAGARQIIARHHPICFVEVFKTDVLAVKSFFKDLDYHAYQVRPEDWIFVPKHSDVDLDLPNVLL